MTLPETQVYTGTSPPFQIYKNIPVGVGTLKAPNSVCEPSVATDNTGQYIFYTGNPFAGKSTDYGNTWIGWDNSYGSSTIDQDVLYDYNRKMFVWSRLVSGSIEINISTDNLTSWKSYQISGVFDYPNIAINQNYLYVTASGILFRCSLNDLQSGQFDQSKMYVYNSPLGDIFTLAHEPPNSTISGIYFADTSRNGLIIIYYWDEISGNVTSITLNIPSWTTPSQGYLNCIGPDGYNWCNRASVMETTGWHSKGNLGFMWHSDRGSGFNWPYIEAALIRDNDFAYIGRPLIYNQSYACLYPNTYPDALGNVGLTFFWGGGNYYGSHAVGIWDGYTSDPMTNGWTSIATNIGTADNVLADYVRVRPYRPYDATNMWCGTSYTWQGGTTIDKLDRRYVIFGRNCYIISSCNLTCPTNNIIAGNSFNLNVNWTGGSGSYNIQIYRDGNPYGSVQNYTGPNPITVTVPTDSTWTSGSHLMTVNLVDSCNHSCYSNSCAINLILCNGIAAPTNPNGYYDSIYKQLHVSWTEPIPPARTYQLRIYNDINKCSSCVGQTFYEAMCVPCGTNSAIIPITSTARSSYCVQLRSETTSNCSDTGKGICFSIPVTKKK